MIRMVWQRIRNADWLLFGAFFFMLVLGLTVIYGLSINPTEPDPVVFRKQLLFAVLGIAVFFVVTNMNYRFLATYSRVIYLALFALLVGTLFFGTTVRGTTGWISLGPASFQPVEFAKIGLIIFLAKYFADHGRQFFLWRHIIVSGLATLAYVGVVLRQPDFGSAIVMLGMWLLMLIVVGIPRQRLIILGGVLLVTAAAAWLLVLEPYQKDRIVTFLNPQSDVLGIGYNVRQSVIAVGSGRIFGRGFALGSQSQLKFLPEAETDFIFAVLGEELGFVGVLLLFAGLFTILVRLLVIAHRTNDNFAAFFALGVAALITVQSFINIGMNMGIAPVTGIPLPLISAGGSSLLSFCLALAVVSSIVADNRSLGAAA